MSREIKFRLWDKFQKKFLSYPMYINSLNGKELTAFDRYFNVDEDDLVIQQYTGLKDKNGKEIYEGDIFRGSNHQWDCVKFEDGKFVVNLRGARVYDLCELFENNNHPEVIGNIFENPQTNL